MRQRLERVIAHTVLGLPSGVVRQMGGPPIQRGQRTLDPQVQLALTLQRLSRKPHSHEVPVATARRIMDESGRVLAPTRSNGIRVEERTLGARPVRIYRPRTVTSPSPTVLYFHGGGFMLGSLDSHDGPCRELAARVPATVISVDYRLAPEDPFPAAVDDGLTVFRALVKEADTLGVDPARIAIGGDSAGGNMSAVLAADTRDDETRPCFQLLIYPATDLTMSAPSITEMGSGFFLERETMTWFREHYLAGEDPRHPRASPMFIEDLTGLPPALVITAGFDPLRDEGDAYAERLREAGVSVAHHRHESLFHGFWNTTAAIREAERAFDEAVGVLRAAF